MVPCRERMLGISLMRLNASLLGLSAFLPRFSPAPKALTDKFGLSLSTRAVLFDWGTMDDVLDMAEIADPSGLFHGVWVGDTV